MNWGTGKSGSEPDIPRRYNHPRGSPWTAPLGLPELATEDPQRIARALEWHEGGIDFA